MPSGTNTPKLNLTRIQEDWKFGDESFNRFIDDADNKLVGVAHLESPMHWTEWTKDTSYAKGDVVRYPNLKSHQYAVCLSVSGTSGTTVPINNVTGSIVIDNDIEWEVRSLTEAAPDSGTIKIWLGGTVYTRGDAVRYGDALYRAKIDHTASMDFATDENWWQEIYASIRFWKPNIYYYLDDTAIYDDIIYKCIRAHKSVSNFETVGSTTGDEDDWEIIGGAGGAKDWATNTKYQVGQLVLVNGILYRCNTKHKSTTFSSDILKWDLVEAQIHDWATAQYYVAGTLVSYNNVIYKCLTNHTASAAFETDISNWTLYHNTIVIWDRNKSYYQGQIVIYSGTSNDYRLYRCNTTHVSPNEIVENAGTENETTRNATFLDDIANWDALDASIAVWKKNDVYKIGDIVLYDNEPFRCVKNHTSGNNNDSTIFDNITDNISTNCWEYVGTKNAYIFPWQASTHYNVNQCVTYNNKLYKCKQAHISSDMTTDIFTNWDMISGDAKVENWATSTNYIVGQLVLYNNTLYRCNTAHVSDTFVNDTVKWDLVYANLSEWLTSVYYKVGSVVVQNNKIYKCTTAHTSNVFNTDSANWELIGGKDIEIWATGAVYRVGQIVIYTGTSNDCRLYRCNTTHTSSTFTNDIANWDSLDASIATWKASTQNLSVQYKVGDIVIYNNELFRCVKDHTSSTTNIFANITDSVSTNCWEHVALKNSYVFPWAANTLYNVNQVVLYDSVIYRCNTKHTSGSTFDVTKWDLIYANIRQYANSTIYKVNSMVVYNGNLYRCLQNHTSNMGDIGTNRVYYSDTEILHIYSMRQSWVLIPPLPASDTIDLGKICTVSRITATQFGGYSGISDMDVSVSTDNVNFTNIYHYSNPSAYAGDTMDFNCYGVGRYVRFTANNVRQTSAGSSIGLIYTTVYESNPYWEHIGDTFIYDWQTSKQYFKDQIVLYENNFYRCKQTHTSSSMQSDLSVYWEALVNNKIATKEQVDALFI